MNDSFIVTIVELSSTIIHVEAQWECCAPEEGDFTLLRSAAKAISGLIARIGTTDVVIDVKFFAA